MANGFFKRILRPIGFFQRNGEVEGTPFAGLAFHPDLPSHHPHQSGRDGQTQAGTSEATIGGLVCLGKRFKNAGLTLLGYPDAGVADLEVDQLSVLVNPYGQAAFLGELETVADQIYQDLTQALGVPLHPPRDIGVNMVGQLQALEVRLQSHCFQRIHEPFVEVEFGRVQLQLAGLDLREIQNLVDHPEQGVRGMFHGFQILFLAAVQAGL